MMPTTLSSATPRMSVAAPNQGPRSWVRPLLERRDDHLGRDPGPFTNAPGGRSIARRTARAADHRQGEDAPLLSDCRSRVHEGRGQEHQWTLGTRISSFRGTTFSHSTARSLVCANGRRIGSVTSTADAEARRPLRPSRRARPGPRPRSCGGAWTTRRPWPLTSTSGTGSRRRGPGSRCPGSAGLAERGDGRPGRAAVTRRSSPVSGPARPQVVADGACPGAKDLVNLLEFVIHHEDVRRAQPGWGAAGGAGLLARTTPVWRAIPNSARRPTLRKAPERGHAAPGRHGLLGAGEEGPAFTVTVTGDPVELALFTSGRPAGRPGRPGRRRRRGVPAGGPLPLGPLSYPHWGSEPSLPRGPAARP